MRRAALLLVVLVSLGVGSAWLVSRVLPAEEGPGRTGLTDRRADRARGSSEPTRLAEPRQEPALEAPAPPASTTPAGLEVGVSEASAPLSQDSAETATADPEPASDPASASARLTLAVTDAEGLPLAGAQLLLFDEQGARVPGGPWTTDGAGSSPVLSLAPGVYHAYAATADGRAAVSGPRRIAPESPDSLTVAVGQGSRLWPRFDDPEQQARATFAVFDARGRELSALSLFSAGQAPYPGRPVGPLPMGRYRVEGRLDGAAVTERWVTLLEFDRTVRFAEGD